jgi:hypothetical protein
MSVRWRSGGAIRQFVVAGLALAVHVFFFQVKQDVNARHRPGITAASFQTDRSSSI